MMLILLYDLNQANDFTERLQLGPWASQNSYIRNNKTNVQNNHDL